AHHEEGREAHGEEDREAADHEEGRHQAHGEEAHGEEAHREEDSPQAREADGDEAHHAQAGAAEGYEAPLAVNRAASASRISSLPIAVSRRVTIVPAPSTVYNQGSLGSFHASTVGDCVVPRRLL